MGRIIPTLVFTAALQCPVASLADESPYRYFNSKLADYFSDTAYLPVWPLPQGEDPGDIYDGWSDQRTGFLVRSAVCFEGVPAYTAASRLIDMGHFSAWELSGSIDVPVQAIADVTVEGGRDSLEKIGLAFSGVYVSGLTGAAMKTELLSPSDECRDAMLLYGLEHETYTKSVPVILQEVIYGKPDIAFHVKQGVSVGAAAEIGTGLKRIPEVKVEADSVVRTESDFSFVSDEAIPIAWRPLLISKSDLERLQELEDNGFFLRLRRWVGLRGTREDERAGILESFYEVVPDPDELFERMTTPPSIEFDPGNPVHLRYLQKKGQLLAISIDMYRG